MKDNVFRIDWGTGFADIKTDTFFIEAKVTQIKKMCKLAQRYSTEKERTELLIALDHEDKMREALLGALSDLAYKKSELANSFYHTNFRPEQGWAEKRLIAERAKLAKAIDILADERWIP